MKRISGTYWVVLLSLFVSALASAAPDASMAHLGNEYPIVLMAVPPTDKDFAHAKDMGAGYVHLYGLSESAAPRGMEGMRRYLDLAQKHGLKVMFDLDGMRRMKKSDGQEEMKRIVDAFKDHPALGFWFLDDEPDGHGITAATVQTYYDLIKKEAPKIPVCVLTTILPQWNDYHNALDIYSFDTYDVYTNPFPQTSIDRVPDINELAIRQGKPVMPCLQAYNRVFEFVISDLKDGTFNKPAVRAKLKNYRYPKLQELRFWQFSTLVQGSRGVLYYSYLRGAQTELDKPYDAQAPKDWKEGLQIDPHWLDDTLKPAIQELKTFTDLVAPAWDHQIIPSERTQNLLEGVWKRGNKTYVVMINKWPLTRTILLSPEMTAPFEHGKVKPWGFSRKVIPQLGTDKRKLRRIGSMDPWEVLVWEISPQ